MRQLNVYAAILSLFAITAAIVGCDHRDAPRAERAAAPGNIDRARLLAATNEPGQWLATGSDWRGTHYSRLGAINAANVGSLGFAWSFDTDTNRGLEATPIVVDGVMYTSGVAGRVYALDATSGTPKWRFEPNVDLQVARAACCDLVNRGVAVWRGKVYVATLDGWLYALDARTGAVVWNADTLIDRKRGYTSTGAPQVAGNVVVIGNAGGEFDVRGYLTAYDLDTGQLRWRFFTVPGDPRKPFEHPELELASKTWDRNSAWQYGGGGPVWDGLAYDPGLDLLYVGTGNAETYPRTTRSPSGGDNLFTSCVLAIAPKTGRLVWYYQETPGDQWDFDSNAPFVLVDREVHGVPRKLLLHAPKNGLFYVLDRTDGSFVSATKFARANWTSGADAKTGRITIDRSAADYTQGPKLIFPSAVGAHSWNPMAYSPDTGLVYLPTIELGNVFFDISRETGYRPGLFNAGIGLVFSAYLLDQRDSLPPPVKGVLASGALLKGNPDLAGRAFLQAWDPIEQHTVWKTLDHSWWDHAGVLATAGGLVFQGRDTGELDVLDAASGNVLKRINTGTGIIAAPMSYQVNGVQYIAVMAGWGGGGWAVPHPQSALFRYGNAGRVLAFKLGGGSVPLREPLPAPDPIPAPPPQMANSVAIARGAALFGSNCGICHPNQTRSSSADLRRMSPATHAAFQEIVLGGMLKGRGMPAWSDVLTPTDADAIHAFLIDSARQAYEAEQATIGAGKKAAQERGGPTNF
jgi:quinohemoprotein ethanol dehydrogenase